jgi:hypothetical protein
MEREYEEEENEFEDDYVYEEEDTDSELEDTYTIRPGDPSEMHNRNLIGQEIQIVRGNFIGNFGIIRTAPIKSVDVEVQLEATNKRRWFNKKDIVLVQRAVVQRTPIDMSIYRGGIKQISGIKPVKSTLYPLQGSMDKKELTLSEEVIDISVDMLHESMKRINPNISVGVANTIVRQFIIEETINVDDFIYELARYLLVFDNAREAGFTTLINELKHDQINTGNIVLAVSENYEYFSIQKFRETVLRIRNNFYNDLNPTARRKITQLNIERLRETIPERVFYEPSDMVDSDTQPLRERIIDMSESLVDSSTKMEKSADFAFLMGLLDDYQSSDAIDLFGSKKSEKKKRPSKRQMTKGEKEVREKVKKDIRIKNQQERAMYDMQQQIESEEPASSMLGGGASGVKEQLTKAKGALTRAKTAAKKARDDIIKAGTVIQKKKAEEKALQAEKKVKEAEDLVTRLARSMSPTVAITCINCDKNIDNSRIQHSIEGTRSGDFNEICFCSIECIEVYKFNGKINLKKQSIKQLKRPKRKPSRKRK